MSSWLRQSLYRLLALFRRVPLDRELDAEMDTHVEFAIEENLQRGLSAHEARRQALIHFGGALQARENHRDARGLPFLESLLQDLRFGLRTLCKSPGFSAVALITLALGIGVNTAIFGAVKAILLQPLPYPEPMQLVTIAGYKHFSVAGVVGYVNFAPTVWRDIQAKSSVISQLATYDATEFTMTGEAEPEMLTAAKVSGDFFPLFGVPPLLGRPILASDADSGDGRVAVLSFTLWHSSFGSDPGIVGRTIFLNQQPYAVIGVMPPALDFGLGERGVWVPQTDQSEANAIARLKKGVTVKQANSQLRLTAAWLAAKDPKLFKDCELLASQLGRATDETGNGLLVLFGAAGFVLLIACANVSALVLARGGSRLREVAIRKALGASRIRIARQLLVEAMLLSVCGGLLSLLLSIWGIRTLRTVAPLGTPSLEQIRVDLIVLSFTAGVSLMTGILLGLAPAWQVSGDRPGAAFNENLGSSTTGFSASRPRRLRSVLIVVEVGLAVILVLGATLSSRSLGNIMNLKLGFQRDHILTGAVDFSSAVCDLQDKRKITQCELAISNILDRIQALPGVEAVAFTPYVPLGGAEGALSLRIEGSSSEAGIEHGSLTVFRPVSAGYFQTMGIPILAGRSFSTADTRTSEPVAVVNETFARNYLSGRPLGHRISQGEDKNGKPRWMKVVGEVRDSRDVTLLEKPSAEYYVPFAQANYLVGANFIVRTTEQPLSVAVALRQRVWEVDRNAPVADIKTMDDIVGEQVAEPKFRARLLEAFGLLALILASVGIYGIISHSVSYRVHEIGVRMAVGAQPRDMWFMVIKEGMLLVGIGIAIGNVGAIGLTHFLENLLFGIKPTDLASFIGVSILLTVAALLACYIPARRATSVDPMTALRYE